MASPLQKSHDLKISGPSTAVVYIYSHTYVKYLPTLEKGIFARNRLVLHLYTIHARTKDNFEFYFKA